MEFASTVEFAHAARALTRGGAAVAGRPELSLSPRLVGVDRSIRHRRGISGDDPVVSVRVKGRPREAVLADMIEGIVVANGLLAPEADRVRNELWQTVTAEEFRAAS